jgi:hypothetical protein
MVLGTRNFMKSGVLITFKTDKYKDLEPYLKRLSRCSGFRDITHKQQAHLVT